MRTGWLRLVLISTLLACCIAGAAGAAQLSNEWKERSSEDDGPYSGVLITPDASLVYAGGNSIFVRSWDREIHWGNRPASAAALSLDGRRVVLGVGNKVSVLDSRGNEEWYRNMDGFVKAVAISPNGSFIISADDKGNYNSWGRDGNLIARYKNDTATALAWSPSTDLIAASTDRGLRFFNRKLDPVWNDTRTESRDEFLSISLDGSTVIAGGYREVASYSAGGDLNWRREITTDPIIDMHTSLDCAAIIVAGQDKEVVAVDRYGNVRWRYETPQWISAVGASRDAWVIAAGGIDRTIYLLDRSGNLLTTRKTDAIIQPRSIAVSSDGRRVVVADQKNLYGYTVMGDAVAPEITLTYTVTPLNPVETTNPVTVPATTLPLPDTPVIPTATTIAAKPTTYAPVNPLLFLPAIAAAILLCRRRQ